MKLADKVATWLDTGGSGKRSVLDKITLGASALAVAPIQYVTRPGTAEAAFCTVSSTPPGCQAGGSCTPGDLCCDGWTAFCCQLSGNSNYACPPYSYPAGYWKVDVVSITSGICGSSDSTNRRYYVDCNRLPNDTCPGGCKCATGDCSKRRTCCNCFEYGNCNANVGTGKTQVVCRLVTCVKPWAPDMDCLAHAPGNGCTDSVMFDDNGNTKIHADQTPCLN